MLIPLDIVDLLRTVRGSKQREFRSELEGKGVLFCSRWKETDFGKGKDGEKKRMIGILNGTSQS